MDLLISYAVVLLPLWPIPFSIGGRKILGILCCGQNSNNRLPVLHLASYDPDDQGRARSDHESPLQSLRPPLDFIQTYRSVLVSLRAVHLVGRDFGFTQARGEALGCIHSSDLALSRTVPDRLTRVAP